MHNLDINKKNKLDISELNLLLMTEMGFFGNLKKKKIKFNPRPFSKSKNLEDKKTTPSNEKFVDLHLDTIKKIDELIEQHKKELANNRFESRTQNNISFDKISELRESKFISPEMKPSGQSSLQPENITRELDRREEFFEIEQPVNFSIDVKNEQENDIQNWMIDDRNNKTRRLFWNFGKMKSSKSKNVTDKKVLKKVNQEKRTNNVTKTKLELEKSKQEIENKKKALETAIKKEKQKEIELQHEIEEKKKQEKLKKLELKKNRKEQKIREKETKKAEKEKQKKLEIRKKQEKNEAIKAEKELKQKTKEEEKEKKEKLKKLETQKKQEKIESIKAEKELKQKRKEEEKEKKEKLKKLEIQKKSKEKEIKESEKEKHKKKKTEEQEEIQPEIEEPADLGTHVEEEKEPVQETIPWDEDVEKLLPIIDNLFANLPDNIIDEFTQSEDFKLYEKVVLKYKNK